MWTYEQRTGIIRHNGEALGTGYAGMGEGKNNPEAQSIPDVGPLPQGLYLIGRAYSDPHLGPVAMRLVPERRNEMFGRAGFLIHADSIHHPGEASHGCIVLSNALRSRIAESGDTDLLVVAG
jgi:hypothetical protein